MAGNPDWKKGMKSPNPLGRGIKMRHSSRTVKGMIERFIKRNITPNKLQKMYDGLKDREKLEFLTELLPYAASKNPTQVDMTIEQLNDTQLNTLYDSVISGLQIGYPKALIAES